MVADNSRKPKISFAATYASSAFSACCVELCTIPFNTAKVRLQLQRVVVVGGDVTLPKYRGMIGTVATVAREEGLFSLWRGIAAGLHCQCMYGGLRVSLYEPTVLKIPRFMDNVSTHLLSGLAVWGQVSLSSASAHQ